MIFRVLLFSMRSNRGDNVLGKMKFGNITYRSLMLIFCLSILLSACSSNQNKPSGSSEIAKATIHMNTETPVSAMALKLTDTKFRENVAALTQTIPPLPEKTATAMPIQIPVMFEDTAILTTNLGHDLDLIEIQTGKVFELPLDEKFPTFLDWKNNGCDLLIRTEQGNLETVNLDGEWTNTMFSVSDLKHIDSDPYAYYISPSPDENWLWYWHVSGNFLYEMGPEFQYEVQEVFTISRDLKQGPYQISKNGGGWTLSWSPDSEYLAFSDLDEHGRLQVFIATKEGADKKQITNFEYKEGKITDIEWSPNGNFLAIVFYRGVHDTTVIELENNNVMYQENNARFLWWIDNSNVFIRDESSLRSYNLQNDQPVFTIPEIDYPHIRQFQPFVYPHLAGFFAKDDLNLFIFNGLNGNVIQIPTVQAPIDLIEWTTTPVDFPGVEFCLGKSIR